MTQPIHQGMHGPIAWILERPHFAEGELADAFGDMPESACSKLLANRQMMAVISPA